MRIPLAAALAVGIAAPAAHALSVADVYTSFTFFGDSLSDAGATIALPGNAFTATEGLFAAPPYFNGRFSDGPLWSDLYAAPFGPGRVANMAVGGATALPQPTVFGDNSLAAQRLRFDAAVASPFFTLGARPLAAIWIGANDVGAGDLSAAAATVASEIADLAADYGILDFLVFDLPDLGRWPGPILDGTSLAATAGSAFYNLALDANLDAIEALNPALRITRFEVSALFDAVLDDPAAFGMPNGIAPCFLSPDPACASPTQTAFFDPIHPSSTMHALIAQAAVSATPVPVPAALPLLALGLAGLVAFRRRAA